MLIDFTVKNYLSIKNEVTLSMVTSEDNKTSDEKIKTISIDNNKYTLHCMAGIYGPNASGKSNLIKAFSDFRDLILNSQKYDLDHEIPCYKPFKFDPACKNEPVKFEAEFCIEDTRYLFYVEFTRTEIIREQLYFWPGNKIATLYSREQGFPIDFGAYLRGDKKSIERHLEPNMLFLSKAANSKNEMLESVYRHFRNNYKTHVRMDSRNLPLLETTFRLGIDKDNFYKNLVIGILNAGDINIKDIKIETDPALKKQIEKAIDDGLSPNIKKEFSFMSPEKSAEIQKTINEMVADSFSYKVYLGHSVYSRQEKTSETVYLDLLKEESSGTLKLYDMAIEIIDSLMKGTTLFIDEFNSGLHPHLNIFIVKLFLDPRINRKGAQLIISTHDTCVLEDDTIRRDQVWFTDKDKEGATELFSLDEFDKDKVRSSTNFSKWYLDGRFKAVPSLDYNRFKLWDN